MRSLRLRAFGKANLSLNITGRRANMHELDSVMATVDVFDTVTVTERADKQINVSFVGRTDIDAVNNTAYKAAHLVMQRTDIPGVDIVVNKGIPIGAGLGGSSADGAAVLRALDVFYRLPALGVDMRDIALQVGSDVPFMLTGGMARVKGLGEDLFFMENKLSLFAVGLMSAPVSTAAAYKKFDELCGESLLASDNDKLCEKILSGDNGATEFFGNALTEPAKALSDGIAESIDRLKALGAVANLTGSGGMVLGWYTSIDDVARAASTLSANKTPFKIFTTAKTGVLHEWVSR